MEIIEIYKDSIECLWHNDETFLCVFDENNNLIADYDLCNGLRLLQKDREIIIYVNDFDFVSGKWILFATKSTKINGEYVKEKIKVSGKNLNGSNNKEIKEKGAIGKCFPGEYVSVEEREERLLVCKECPLFDKENMTCSVNDKIVLESTKYKYEYCPEERWGNKEASLEKDGIIMPQINEQEQEDFEKELEEYLKGL